MKEYEYIDFQNDYVQCLFNMHYVKIGNYNYEKLKKFTDSIIQKYRFKPETINFYISKSDARTYLPIEAVLNMVFEMLNQYGFIKYGKEKMEQINEVNYNGQNKKNIK